MASTANLTQGKESEPESPLLPPLMRHDEFVLAATKPLTEVVETHQDVVVETHPEVIGETTAAAFAQENADDTTTTTTTSNKRKGSKNAGSKKGSKRVERPQSFWYRLCELFEQGDYKSQIDFLRSPDSGEDVSAAHRMHFSRAYKKYTNGTLANIEESRARKRKYEPLEMRVIEYWTQQQQLLQSEESNQGEEESQSEGGYNYEEATEEYAFATTNSSEKKRKSRRNSAKSNLAWSNLQQKAREWAKEMGLDDGFQASAGWIDNVLKRHRKEVHAKSSRLSLDATLAQRRSWANYASGRAALERELLISDQVALLQAKQLKVGDRVTVMEVSQQAGDLVITQITLPPGSSGVAGLKQSDSTNSNNENDEEPAHTYLTVERKRHGSTQTFSVTDVRKVVLHLVQEEDTMTIRRLLEPRLDAFLAAKAHFPKYSPGSSRMLRPIWEDTDDEDNESATTVKETTSVRIPFTDTSCAEKIDLHALRSHLLPMFKRDHKSRVKLLEELQRMPQRSTEQQKVLETLQYAQMTHDMAKDFLDDIADKIPTKGSFVIYQVDYQALDISMRGHLFAQTPAPVAQDASKSYAPRPLTLQAMPEDLRNALVGQFAHLVTTDQDIKLDIFCSLADMAQASNLIPAWRDYRERTSAWCDFILQTHEGISQEQADLLPRVLLQGGTYDTWKQAMDEQTAITLPATSDEAWTSLQTFVMRLENEWRMLRDIVLTMPQYAWTKLDKTALLTSHDCAPAAIPNICMVRILLSCEREIWTLVAHVLQSQGWVVRAKLIEGLLVESPSMAGSLAAAMSVAETSIKSRGWDVVLIEGQCFGKYSEANHKAPLPLLQEARLAMEELQQSMSAETCEEDNNAPLADDGAVAGAKPDARNLNWNDNGTPKPHGNHATNNEMGGAEATKSDLPMFAQL